MPSLRPHSRADRLELVARMLRDRPGITAAALAQSLGVSGRSVFRDLDALLIEAPAWYLVAFDHLRGAPRTFRLDRFAAVEVEDATCRPRAAELVATLRAETGGGLDAV